MESFWDWFKDGFDVNANAVNTNINTVLTTKGIIVEAQLAKVLPNLTQTQIIQWTAALNSMCPKYGITTAAQFVMFLTQVVFESNRFTELTENLNYSAQGLLNTFPSHFTSEEANDYARQPEKIANRAYANRMGNGSESSGDGWLYRGRGLIQLTGKDNYVAFSNSCGKALADTTNYCATPTGATESACWYWQTHNLTRFSSYADVTPCTKIINGGLNGLDQRQAMYTQVLKEIS